MGNAVVWKGKKALVLPSEGIELAGGAQLVNIDFDPTTLGGFAAPVGSIALVDLGGGVGASYIKTGVADTAWAPQTAGISGGGASTDNALVRWDGAGGNVVQNSTAILTDAGDLTTKSLTLSGTGADTVPYLDASKKLTSSSVTPTELGYVSGVTSAIQTQINGKEPTQTKGSISTSTTGITITNGANSTVGPAVTVDIQNATDAQPGLLTSADHTSFAASAALTSAATNTNTINTIVKRDANGDFSMRNLDSKHMSAGEVDKHSLSIESVTQSVAVMTTDYSNTDPYGLLIHKHSTTQAPTIAGARSNSNDSTHSIVTNNQVLLDVQGIGRDTASYLKAATVELSVDAVGTPSATSMPGRITFKTTPDGSIVPTEAAHFDSTQKLKLTNDLEISEGGTGASTQQAAINALAGAVTSGQYLRGNGTNVVMSGIQAGDVPTLNQNTSGTAAGLSATLVVGSGGTGATTASGARDSLGAEQVFNGLEDITKFSIAYSASTRKFTITYFPGAAVTVGGVRYLKNGTAGNITEDTTAHAGASAADSKLYFCYFDASGNLTVSSTPWDLLTTAPIAAAYYAFSNAGGAAAGILIDERHLGGSGMSNATHRYLHLTQGTKLISGCVIDPLSYTPAGTTLAAISYGVSSGTLQDEDLAVTAAAITDNQGITTTPYRIFYKSGTSPGVWNWVDSLYPYHTNGTDPYYNQLSGGSYVLTAANVNNRWINYWLLATTSSASPQTVIVMGETLSTSLAAAQALTFAQDVTNISALTTEGVVLYRTTMRRIGNATTKNTTIDDVAQITQSIVGTPSTGAITAASVSADVTNFDNLISPSDNTVQKALDRIDDHTHAARMKNYIKDGAFIFPTADAQALTGWSQTKNTTPGATPEVSPGGTPDAAFAFLSTTTSPLMGTYSALLTQTAANLQGNSWRYAFTLDRNDLAKVQSISFDYEIASGTFVDGDITVWISDGTNIIQPAPYTILNASGPQRWQGEFQTSASATNYQLIFHRPNTTATAFTLKVDNIVVGTRAKVFGAPVTDWQIYTPTISAWSANTTATGKWRRVGDSMEIAFNIALSGAPTGTLSKISVPSGFSIDTTKTNNTTFDYKSLITIRDSGTNTYNGAALVSNSDSTNILLYVIDASANDASITATVPMTFANGDNIAGTIRVPILGWSSSTQMSDSADTRVVAAKYIMSASSSNISIANNAYETIDFDTKVFDTHGAVTTGASWKFTAPSPGYYRVSTGVNWASTTNMTNSAVKVFKTGSASEDSLLGAFATGMSQMTGSATFYLQAGDVLTPQVYQADSGAAARNLTSSSNTYITIEKLSGPSQIAASESVSASYSTGAGQTITNSGGPYVIDFGTKAYDSHGAVTTGASWKFTAPISGEYEIAPTVLYSSNAYAVGNVITLQVWKNGAYFRVVDRYEVFATIAGAYMPIKGKTSVKLLAGEYVDVRTTNARTAGNTAIHNDGSLVYLDIKRTGNY